jgi:glutaredoxin 3
MAKVEIYTSPFCGYCHRAKALLERRGAAYTEYDVVFDPARREEMQARATGARTVPQIFINGRPIGGSDQLAALDKAGELASLLAAPET